MSQLPDLDFKDYVNSLTAATANDLKSGNNFPLVGEEVKKLKSGVIGDSLDVTNGVSYKFVIADKKSVHQPSKMIDTSVEIGSVVDMTPTTQGGNQLYVLDCKKNDFFLVKGIGGSARRLWAFVDNESKLISHAGASAVISEPIVLVAPADGKVIFQSFNNYANDVFSVVENVAVSLEKTKKSAIEESVSVVKNFAKNINSFVDKKSVHQPSKMIDTSVEIGSVVDMTPTTQGGNQLYVFDCKKNDFFLVEGIGGSARRLWAFVDANNMLLLHADADVSLSEPIVLVAPADGKIIFQSFNNFANDVFSVVEDVHALINSDVSSFKNDIENVIKNYVIDSGVFDDKKNVRQTSKMIDTSVEIGSVVDMTPITSGGNQLYVLDCTKNEMFLIAGVGGSARRLWAFVDTNNTLLSHSEAGVSLSEPIVLIAPSDGKVIFQSFNNLANDVFSVIRNNFGEENLGRIEALEVIPNVKFDYDDEMFEDVDVESFDFQTKSGIMDGIYELMDSLVSDNQDFMTRVDAYSFAELSKPVYMNGISEGDEHYLPTQSYNTYLYKISDVNIGSGNAGNVPKKNLFILGGVHGNEYASQFNCYLFAKNLLGLKTADLFKILASYDVYVLPVLNGYGSIHESRANADWTDINRNFPVSGWYEANSETIGSTTGCTYTGPSAGSAAETQLVIKLCEIIKPDVFIDHHSYSIGGSSASAYTQFYDECGFNYQLPLVYQSLVDCSFAFSKNYQEYFGNKYNLLIHRQTADYAPAVAHRGRSEGYSYVWCCEHLDIVKFAITVEICQNINYYGGHYTDRGAIDAWGKKTFAIGEFTLRNQVTRFCEYMLNPKKIKD